MYIICHIMYLAAQHMLLSARADFPSSILKITVDVVGLLMVLYPLLPETPYWLVLNGDLAGADAVLQRMAKINGVHLPQVTPRDMCMWRQAGWYSTGLLQGGRRCRIDQGLSALTWPHGNDWVAVHLLTISVCVSGRFM